MADKNFEKINKNIEYLYETILRIETMEECEALFDDLCTKTELASISQRLVVAKMLSEKRYTTISLLKQAPVLQQ